MRRFLLLGGFLLLGLIVASVLAGWANSGVSETSACARGYQPCLPIVGDLDCGQIPDAKKPVRVTGTDPYGLDRDRDGLGCELSGEGGGSRSPWGMILRKPPRKEATSAKVGDTLTVVGWSPRAMKGKPYVLCSQADTRITCKQDLARRLTGTIQTFGTWKVARRDIQGGILKVALRVNRTTRAFDTVPVR
jgi:hypothetical protein